MRKETQRYKLALFDIDGTLLQGRSIFIFAEKKGFQNQLHAIVETNKEPLEKSIEIAQLLKGYSYSELLRIFQRIPLQPHVHHIVNQLKENHISTAVVTDGYQCFADDLKQRLGLDYAFGNELVVDHDIVTGSLQIHNQALMRCNDGRLYSICKGAVLESLCTTLHISTNEAIAVGDGIVDRDMIELAGLGVAYRAPQLVQDYADVCTDDLRVILPYIRR